MVEILNDPNIRALGRSQRVKNVLRADIVDQLMSIKTWPHMDADERKICIHGIVSQVESEDELRRRLTEELGVGCCAINWSDVDENDKTSMEAQALLLALGGLVAKNGALVMVMTADGESY